MQKFVQFFLWRIVRQKMCKKFIQVSYVENYYHEFFQSL